MSGHDLTCREVLDFLGAYLDGELEHDVRSDFEHHLSLCPECTDYLASYRETLRLTHLGCDRDGPLPEEVPEDLVAAILASRRGI
jgi:anti-sigma factor RsiW